MFRQKLSDVRLLFDFAKAAGAGFYSRSRAVYYDARGLKIRQPSAFGFDVRVGNFMAYRRAFPAYFTLSHDKPPDKSLFYLCFIYYKICH